MIFFKIIKGYVILGPSSRASIFLFKDDLYSVTPFQAEYSYVLHYSPISILLTCSISGVSTCFQSKWKTMLILIRWLPLKPADLDLQCSEKD